MIKKALAITVKQMAILILLYRFRFLSTNQLQELLGHKDSRTVQILLADLVQKQYVYSNYDRKKFGKNTKPSVFHLLPKAIQILKQQEDCDEKQLKKIYGEGKRSDGFINDCIFIADMYLKLKDQVSATTEVHFSTKVDLNGYDYFPNPLPDAYIALKEKRKTNRYFVLLLEEKAPKYAYMDKFKKYIDYLEEDTWEKNTDSEPFPSILVICPDYPKKRFLERFIKDKAPKEPFYLTTKNQVRLKGIKSDIWENAE